MTANEIAYARHLEDARHNAETERQGALDVQTRAHQADSQRISAEAARSQASTAAYRAGTERSALAETIRHNSVQESQNWVSTLTDADYKRVTGAAAANQAVANLRNAETRERELDEKKRAAVAAQTETMRTNRANEALRSAELEPKKTTAQAQQQRAAGTMQQAQTAASRLRFDIARTILETVSPVLGLIQRR